MRRFSVFYDALPAVGSGIRPVEADAFEAEQIVPREDPIAITASLSNQLKNKHEIRRLFVDWLQMV